MADRPHHRLEPPRSLPLLELVLVALTLGWIALALVDGLASPAILLVPTSTAMLAGLWLGRVAGIASRLAGAPVSIALLVPVLMAPPGLDALTLGLGAGLLAVLWVGYPAARGATATPSAISRELVLPMAGGVAALVASAIPLLNVFRPAALVIPVFAGLALLVILLAELSTPPVAEPENPAPLAP